VFSVTPGGAEHVPHSYAQGSEHPQTRRSTES